MKPYEPDRPLAVRFSAMVWREAIRGFSGRPLAVAESARAQLQAHGAALSALRPCEALGPDGSELAGCAKLYLPPTEAPASSRPYAFVLQLVRDQDGRLG